MFGVWVTTLVKDSRHVWSLVYYLSGLVRRIFERGVTKLVINTYFILIMVKNHIITN